MENSEFLEGDKVIVSIRRHLFNSRNKKLIEKPNMETDGIFVRYANSEKNAVVKIRTVEGERERSFPISSLRPKGAI